MNLGDRILTLRKSVGLSQEQLAEVVGVSRQAISKWETNQTAPDLDNLIQLASAFSVSTDELLDIETKRESGAECAAKDRGTPIEALAEHNRHTRLFTCGWITLLCGVVMLVAELILVPFIKDMEIARAIARGSGYWPDAIHYATAFPMNIVFIVTLGIILLGAVLMVLVWVKGRRQ